MAAAEEVQQRDVEEMDAIYDRYVKPLEDKHLGKFVAVSRDGKVLLGESSRELTRATTDAFGPGNFIFKIGPRVVGKWL